MYQTMNGKHGSAMIVSHTCTNFADACTAASFSMKHLKVPPITNAMDLAACMLSFEIQKRRVVPSYSSRIAVSLLLVLTP